MRRPTFAPRSADIPRHVEPLSRGLSASYDPPRGRVLEDMEVTDPLCGVAKERRCLRHLGSRVLPIQSSLYPRSRAAAAVNKPTMHAPRKAPTQRPMRNHHIGQAAVVNFREVRMSCKRIKLRFMDCSRSELRGRSRSMQT